MSEDYDKLSKTGEAQALKLGQYWISRNITFDRVFMGPSRRHAHTAAIVAEAFRSAGRPWPEAVVLADMDEFDAFKMLKLMAPLVAERDAAVRELQKNFLENQQKPEAGELLQALFEAVARHWSSGEFDIPEVESWAAFRGRVERAVAHVRSLQAGSPVVFTSGGPIAATIGMALELSHVRAVELLWLSRNCAYSEFLVTGGHFLLASFNSYPHLDEEALLTYR